MSKNKICNYCGKTLEKKQKICPVCGKKIKKHTLFKIFVVLVVVFILICIFAPDDEKKKSSENDVANVSQDKKNEQAIQTKTINPIQYTPVSDFNYEINATTGGITIIKYKGSSEKIIIPETIEGLPVKILAGGAFAENETITEVVLPSALEIIMDGESTYQYPMLYLGVFAKCSKLFSISLPEGLKEIGRWTFYYCNNLKQIKLPLSLKRIGESAFEHSGITSIEIPDQIITIEKTTFGRCGDLVSVTFPANIQKVEDAAFSKCYKLVHVIIPVNITNIKWSVGANGLSNTFYDCSRLSSESINRLKEVGYKGYF